MSEHRPPADDTPTERIPRVRVTPSEPSRVTPSQPSRVTPSEPSQVIPRNPTRQPPGPPPHAPTRRLPTAPPRPLPPTQPGPVPPSLPPPRSIPPPRTTTPRKRPPPPPRRQAPTSRGVPAPHRAARKAHWGKRILVFCFLLTLLAGVTGITTAIWAESALHRIPVFSEYDGRPAPGRGTNWLLVGSDSRADLTPQQQAELSTGGDLGNGRTDTILVVHIPGLGSGEPTTMVSIPRDSYVDIPGYGMDKINAAFAEGGEALLAQTVEMATGLRLDHYAEIGFAGFGAVVDGLGGVQICPTEPIDDSLAGIALVAGCQTVDGPTALGYVRSRATARADLDRMIHQREFMSALLHRAASPWVWLNPWRWYAVPHAAVDALTVDEDTHIWDLARLGWSLRGGITTLTVPIGEFTGNEAGSVVIWDSGVSPELFEALRTDATLPQSVLDAQP